MKSYSIAIVVLIFGYLTLTGFQCGSAEMTTAKLARQQKQYDKAEESILKELAKNDKNEEAWYMLGEIRYETKKYAEMNDAFMRTLALSQDHAEMIDKYRLSAWGDLFNQGVNAFNEGKTDKANYIKSGEKFALATTMVPDSNRAYYMAGFSYYAAKDFENAEKWLNTSANNDPKDKDAASLLGRIHFERAGEAKRAGNDGMANSEYLTAAGFFEKVYNADPADQDNITLLIDAYQLANKEEKALAIARDAVTKDPDKFVYRFAYGVFLLKSEKFAESSEQFQKALDIEPGDPDATYNLGVAFLNWGVAMKEASDKKAATAKSNDKPDLSYKEKFKAALPYLKESAETRSDDATLWLQLGRVYANLNMLKESKDAFDKADKITKGK